MLRFLVFIAGWRAVRSSLLPDVRFPHEMKLRFRNEARLFGLQAPGIAVGQHEQIIPVVFLSSFNLKWRKKSSIRNFRQQFMRLIIQNLK